MVHQMDGLMLLAAAAHSRSLPAAICEPTAIDLVEKHHHSALSHAATSSWGAMRTDERAALALDPKHGEAW